MELAFAELGSGVTVTFHKTSPPCYESCLLRRWVLSLPEMDQVSFLCWHSCFCRFTPVARTEQTPVSFNFQNARFSARIQQRETTSFCFWFVLYLFPIYQATRLTKHGPSVSNLVPNLLFYHGRLNSVLSCYRGFELQPTFSFLQLTQTCFWFNPFPFQYKFLLASILQNFAWCVSAQDTIFSS